MLSYQQRLLLVAVAPMTPNAILASVRFNVILTDHNIFSFGGLNFLRC